MSEMKPRACLIGDVVQARSVKDRAELHRRLRGVLEHLPVEPTTGPDILAGDEVQASFAHLGEALSAALYVRAHLQPLADVRCGIGWGGVTQLDQTTQDGPGWWAARAAIEHVEETQQRAAFRALRTAYRLEEDAAGHDSGPVNAALACRDQLLADLDERGWRILRGLLDGKSRQQIGEAEGISTSAVSQRTIRAGFEVVLWSSEQLAALR